MHLAINTNTKAYPLTAQNIIALHPETSFTVPFELPKSYAWVAEVIPPDHNPETHRAVELPPLELDGVWTQKWAVELLSPEVLAERATAVIAARNAARQRVTEWRDAQERGGILFEHAGRAWDGGLAVRQRLQPLLSLPALPEGFFWTDADNNDVPVSLADLAALCAAHEVAIITRGFEIHVRQREMKTAVEGMDAGQLAGFLPGWAE